MNIRLMSSNIWGDYFGNEVSGRDRQLEGIYRKYLPDALGLQEMTQSWWQSPIWDELKGLYEFVYVPTDGKINYTPLLYNAEKLRVHDSGWHLYHEELDASKGFTWAVFIAKEQPEHKFAVFNTHFMWRNGVEFDIIRRYNAMELTSAMERISHTYACPVFFMGDLNCTDSSLAWKYFNQQGWVTSHAIAKERSEMSSWHGDPVRGEDNRYYGETTDEAKECSIDHIGMKAETAVTKQAVVIDADALDATDHSPIYADIEI